MQINDEMKKKIITYVIIALITIVFYFIFFHFDSIRAYLDGFFKLLSPFIIVPQVDPESFIQAMTFSGFFICWTTSTACRSETVASSKFTLQSAERPIVLEPIYKGQYSPAPDFDIEYRNPITGL